MEIAEGGNKNEMFVKQENIIKQILQKYQRSVRFSNNFS